MSWGREGATTRSIAAALLCACVGYVLSFGPASSLATKPWAVDAVTPLYSPLVAAAWYGPSWLLEALCWYARACSGGPSFFVLAQRLGFL
jgi:hypothetical protein